MPSFRIILYLTWETEDSQNSLRSIIPWKEEDMYADRVPPCERFS